MTVKSGALQRGKLTVKTDAEEYILPVSEENYLQDMSEAESYLASHGGDGFFESFDGKSLHYEYYFAEEPKATVVLVHGFTESAEKLREVSFNFLLWGLNVFAIDNRGHGRSYRLTDDAETVNIRHFDDYVKDLQCLTEKVVRPAVGDSELYIFSHSMGGAIAVQHLQTYPGVFSKAVLSAPMIKPRTMGIPAPAAAALADLFIALGRGDKRVFASKGFDPARTYEQSHDTSKARFDYYQKKRCENRCLQTAAASYRWVREAVRVIGRNLSDKRCEKITARILLCQPEEDSSVFSEKEDEFISKVKSGELVRFKDCRHEIYMSVDSTLVEYYKTIKKFFES